MRKVSYEQAAKMAKENGFFFDETSARSGENVSNCFDQLLEGISLSHSTYKFLTLYLEIYVMRNRKGYEVYQKEILKIQ